MLSMLEIPVSEASARSGRPGAGEPELRLPKSTPDGVMTASGPTDAAVLGARGTAKNIVPRGSWPPNTEKSPFLEGFQATLRARPDRDVPVCRVWQE